MTCRKWSDEQKAGYVLNAFRDPDIHPTLLTQMQGWLVNRENEGQKDRTLHELFEQHCRPADPGERAYRLWQSFQERIEREPGKIWRKMLPKRIWCGAVSDKSRPSEEVNHPSSGRQF